MLKYYGADICKTCVAAKAQLAAKGIEAERIDITENVANLKAFLALRDSNPVFAEAKAEGRIGIPAFLWEDGSVTLDTDWLEGNGTCKDC